MATAWSSVSDRKQIQAIGRVEIETRDPLQMVHQLKTEN